MKRVLLLITLLPSLGACTIQNDYNEPGYYTPPPRAEVENYRAEGYHRSATRHHRGYDNRGMISRDTGSHGHNNAQPESQTHGHDSYTQQNSAVHGHSNTNTPEVRVSRNPKDDEDNRTHGHD